MKYILNIKGSKCFDILFFYNIFCPLRHLIRKPSFGIVQRPLSDLVRRSLRTASLTNSSLRITKQIVNLSVIR